MVKKTAAKQVEAEEVPQLTTGWMMVFVGVIVFIGLLGVRVTDKYDGESVVETSSNSSAEVQSIDTERYSDGLQPTINIVQ